MATDSKFHFQNSSTVPNMLTKFQNDSNRLTVLNN